MHKRRITHPTMWSHFKNELRTSDFRFGLITYSGFLFFMWLIGAVAIALAN